MVHVLVDARLLSGTAGGVQQVLIGMAQGFRAQDTPDLRRTWMVYRGHADWLRATIPRGDEVWEVGGAVELGALRLATRAPRLASRLRPTFEKIMAHRPRTAAPYDRALRARGIDVVHQPFQDGFTTGLPTVYHPHDLQHRHLPENFTSAQIQHRETVWRSLAVRAEVVVVATQWVADDLVRQWAVDREKIQVIPFASVIDETPSAASGRATPEAEAGMATILYPAAFWAHKNHALLVEALAELRRRGAEARLVLPGAHLGTAGAVKALGRRLGVEDLLDMPGYVTQEQLRALYRNARVVCVPTLFEAASFPVAEAHALGVPVAASRVTSLPEQVGDAGLLFDPVDVQDLADALQALLTDEQLRTRCVSAGLRKAANLSWSRTCLALTGVYRICAGEAPLPDERAILERHDSF